MAISKSLEKTWTASSGTRYKGRVRITQAGKKNVSRTKTFSTRIDAELWVKKAYSSAVLGGIDALTKFAIQSEPNLGDALRCVLEKSPTAEKLGRSKRSALKMILGLSIAKVPLSEIRAKHMFMHCEERKDLNKNLKAQTLAHDFSYIATSLKDANPFYGYSIDCSFLSDARSSLQRHGVIARSNERNRRPTKIELDLIERLLTDDSHNKKESLPMLDIFNLAKSDALRRGEFTSLRWSNINWDDKSIQVRDRKHPDHTKRQGGSILCLIISQRAS